MKGKRECEISNRKSGEHAKSCKPVPDLVSRPVNREKLCGLFEPNNFVKSIVVTVPRQFHCTQESIIKRRLERTVRGPGYGVVDEILKQTLKIGLDRAPSRSLKCTVSRAVTWRRWRSSHMSNCRDQDTSSTRQTRSQARTPTRGNQERPETGVRGRVHAGRDFWGHKIDGSTFSRAHIVLLEYPQGIYISKQYSNVNE